MICKGKEKSVTGLSTLCYIEKDGKYLMLHRTVKKNDVNKDKWIGVGGHFEADESPEECILREVKEETGYTLTSYRFCGIVTFVSGNGVTEYMHLFTADGFEGEPIACDEGELEWVDIDKIESLHIWEGDKIFLRLLAEKVPFFSLKLVYDGHDGLISAVLNGKEIKNVENRKQPASQETWTLKDTPTQMFCPTLYKVPPAYRYTPNLLSDGSPVPPRQTPEYPEFSDYWL